MKDNKDEIPKSWIIHGFQEAFKMAAKAYKLQEVPVGCVFMSNEGTQHAEICALKANPRFEEYQNGYLFVTCEPCVMCAWALRNLKLKRVYYGCHNSKFGGNGSVYRFNEMDEKHSGSNYESVGGYYAEDAIKLFQSFYEAGNESIPIEERHRKNPKTKKLTTFDHLTIFNNPHLGKRKVVSKDQSVLQDKSGHKKK